MTDMDKYAMRPHVFVGLWCDCGARHYQRASYYASVTNGNDCILAAGPYPEHGDALAAVEPVRRVVAKLYSNAPDYPWYGYGTLAMPAGYVMPGKLNALVAQEG
jgi:hypothetical protein